MSEERSRVLRMLASGTVTVEQANQLLEKLGEQAHAEDDVVDDQQVDAAADDAPEPMFGQFTFSQALQLGTVGVEPSYVDEVHAAGLTDLSFDQIVQMGVTGVDPAFVVAARESGVDLSFDQIVQLGTVGVEPSYIASVRAAGLTDLSFDQIMQMGVTGVDPAFFVKLRSAQRNRTS